MNKTAIKNFAIWARRKLISDITYKAGLIGISEKGILQPLTISTDNVQFFDIGTGKPTEIVGNEITQRNALINRIKEKESTSNYKTAFQYVMEEVAYTWFNRLIAIRFMEVNDYIPSGIRVLSSETPGKSEPDMVTTPFDTDMKFSPYETDRIVQLKEENKLDELFRMLFIKQCNKLNEILPELFEKTLDYTEYLLTISFTDKDGIVSHLVNDIEEEDFTEAVEIIGWLYQYYNTEPKEEVFALLKKNVKITKERIPAATQLFTPDWIVRYMVENSLGRLWIDQLETQKEFDFDYVDFANFSFGEDENKSITKKQRSLKNNWKYYLEEAEQEEEVKNELYKIRMSNKNYDITSLKVIDPCMGSGHILVYAFDVLMQIYESQGYTQRDAAVSIIENNLYGLDIDDRAYQLAYFAVMMKAKKYDRRFLTRGIAPKVYSIQESNNINKTYLQYCGNSLTEIERSKAIKQMEYLLDIFHDAKQYGSIINVDNCDWKLLNKFVYDYGIEGQISFESIGIETIRGKLKDIISIAEAMAQKYDVVITNPPYMGGSGMNSKVSKYVKENYPDSKSDLFAVFIEKCLKMTNKNRYTAMITQHSFMFLSSYEKLRKRIMCYDFVNMAHLGARAFEEIGGEVVQTTTFIMRKSNISKYKATYARLVDYNTQQTKEEAFLSKKDLYVALKENFSKISGSPIAYWASESLFQVFDKGKSIGSVSRARRGLETGNNDLYLKIWYEVDIANIDFCVVSINDFNKVWIPHNKGGNARKWYGNFEYIVYFNNDGEKIRTSGTLNGYDVYCKEGITWTALTSGKNTFRFTPKGCTFDSNKGPLIVDNGEGIIRYLLGLFNSSVAQTIFKILNPTLSLQNGDVNKLPVIFNIKQKPHIETLVQQNINMARIDWDSFESSWDFVKHPLLKFRKNNALCGETKGDKPQNGSLYLSLKAWKSFAELQYNQIIANEEELNRIFIDIYGLQDELTPEVEDKDVTVTRIYDTKEDIPESMKGNSYVLTKTDVIKSFISYAVGCMFGRYSLDVEGLANAGGEWDDTKYTTFIPDKDNCIPITDEEYFEDDIVGLFVAFVKKVYGIETIEENLEFIAEALGYKGNTSREVIRNYFLNDFFKDHCKTYSVAGSGKRPIYWLYDSGKQNGFKALIYMHRYNADTTGMIRVDYLHKMQKIYMSEIDRMQDMVENSTDNREILKAEKRKEKLIKQLKETKDYDEKIAHIALSRIDIDLDDGVKVNYDKVQTGKDGKKLNILAKI